MDIQNEAAGPQVISVVVAHKDPLMQAGLAATLATQDCFDVRSLATHARVTEYVVARQAGGADVVVTDYDTALSLLETPSHCAEQQGIWPPKLVVVSHRERESDIRYAMNKGVCGYLLSGCALDEMAHGLRAVHQGRRHLDKSAVIRVVESLGLPSLTTREHSVLTLVAVGLVNKSIAHELGISLGTVKTHMKSILVKLGARTRTEAAAIARRRGLVSDIQRPPKDLARS